MSGVTVTRNFGRLADIPLSSRGLMHEVGLLARERMIRRTKAGEDARGYPFRAYSPAYAALKAKALGGSGVNLEVSGNMLRAITIVEETDSSVSLGFKE